MYRVEDLGLRYRVEDFGLRGLRAPEAETLKGPSRSQA